MPNIRSSGVFGGRNAGSGLYEGLPVDVISRRSWFTHFWDFNLSTEPAAALWSQTALTSGTLSQLAGDGTVGGGGVARITATTADQGLGSVQLYGSSSNNGGRLVPAAGRTIVLEAAIENNVWVGAAGTGCSWFFGLGEVDTTFMAATGALAANGGDNHVGFHQKYNDTATVAETSPFMSQAGTAVASVVRTSTGLSLTNATKYLFGLRLEGLTVCSWYFGTRSTGTTEPGGVRWDTKLLQRVTLTNPLVAGKVYTPTFAMIANGTAINFDIDYVMMAQTR